MGNDIAGGKVAPVLEALDVAPCVEVPKLNSLPFPSCAVTCSQARKIPADISTVSRSDSYRAPTSLFPCEPGT